MSTMEPETHLLARVRMLPQELRLQVADYVEFLIQKYSDSAEQEVSDEQMELVDEHMLPYQNYSQEEVVEQLNAALAEIDLSERDEYDYPSLPKFKYDKQKMIDQINASLAEVDQSEDLEIAHAYMRRMGKQIAESNPW